jgi:hypothetical protein
VRTTEETFLRIRGLPLMDWEKLVHKKKNK